MFNLKVPQGQNPRTTCGPRTTVSETLAQRKRLWFLKGIEPRLPGYQAYSLVTTMARETLASNWPLTVANTLSTTVHCIWVGESDVVKHMFVG